MRIDDLSSKEEKMKDGMLLVAKFFGLLILAACPDCFALDNTYYMPDDCANVAACASLMSGGDTLVIRDGIYTGDENKVGNNIPDGLNVTATIIGANGSPTIVRAENDHMVTLDGEGERGLFGFTDKSNIRVQGIRFVRAANGMGIKSSKNITVKTSAFHTFTNNKYGITFGVHEKRVGENPYVYSSYILVEDSWFWGNGRYAVYAHYSDHVTFRRCVMRTDGAQGSAEGEPTSGLAIYSAHDCVVENCISIDTTDPSPSGGDKSGFYTTISSCSFGPSVARTGFFGNIAINVQGQAFQQDPNTSCGSNAGGVFENNVAWDSSGQYGLYTKNIQGLVVNNNTFGHQDYTDCSVNGQGGGHVGSAGSVAWTHNLFTQNNGFGLRDGGSASHNNAFGNNRCAESFPNYGSDYTTPGIEQDPKLKYLPDASITTDSSISPRSSDGQQIGAVIRKRYEGGVLTDNNLWPFPNEAWIKADFAMYSSDAVRDWTATSKTLTQYIWGYLGHECPTEICSGGNPPREPLPPTGLRIQ